jgi:hypothetical protein
MMCALVPQNPKLLTPARRGMPEGSQSMSLSLTKNGLLAKSIRGLGVEKFGVGGIFRWRSAMTTLRTPAIPAAAVAWPKLPLMDPRAQ